MIYREFLEERIFELIEKSKIKNKELYREEFKRQMEEIDLP